jgi:hypothetical protein
MVSAILASGATWFRGHDSGDFFNIAYVEAWTSVCRELPNVWFWFPTREYQVKSDFAMLNPRMDSLRKLASLPNVTVRPSALEIGEAAPNVTGLHAGSAVGNAAAYQCPAYSQNGECGDCRHCWTERDTPVSYPLH